MPRGHLWSASGHGNHAGVSVFAWMVDKCVSYRRTAAGALTVGARAGLSTCSGRVPFALAQSDYEEDEEDEIMGRRLVVCIRG